MCAILSVAPVRHKTGAQIAQVQVRAWSADGTELFFRDTDKMMVASLRGRVVGRPSVLFEKRLTAFDVARDGRFLIALPDEDVPPAPIHIVLNWHEELKRFVPVGR